LFDPAGLRGEKAGYWFNMISRLIVFIASCAVILMLHSDADQRDNANALTFGDPLVFPQKWNEWRVGIPNRGYLDSYPADYNN